MRQELVKGYQKLTVYQLAFEEAMALYWLLPQMPVEDEDLLGQHLVDTSQLVCTQLAEAWEQQRFTEDFVGHLKAAKRNAVAVQTWLAFSVECGYLEPEAGQRHQARYGVIVASVGEMLAGVLSLEKSLVA